MTKEELNKKQTEEVQGGGVYAFISIAGHTDNLDDSKKTLCEITPAAKVSGRNYYTEDYSEHCTSR